MSKAYITEFSDMQPMTVGGGLGSMVLWQNQVNQVVAIGGGSANSNPFNAKTRVIRVNVDVTCSIDIGSAPTASANTARMQAGTTEYFGVYGGQLLAVIANT